MKIALLTPGGIGEETSGMHIPVLLDFVRRLSKYHDVRVYSLAPRDRNIHDGLCGNARVRFFPTHHRKGTPKKVWTLFSACRSDHRVLPFDLVHGLWAIPCGVIAGLLGKYLNIPGVVTFLGGETAYLPQIPYGNMSRPSTRFVTLQVARRADSLVTLTHHQTEELERFGHTRRSCTVIPFGADTSIFTTSEKDVSIRPVRFLHVANLHAIKDQETLLRAFHTVSQSIEARLRIVGEDHTGGACRRLAAQLGVLDNVEFTGYLPQRELRLHYQWAHVLLHTSLHEAQGVVIAEAAASGLLVAGTRTGLLADLGDSMAVVTPLRDHQTLSRKVLSVVADPSKYDALRNAGRQWALAHDSRWTVLEYLKLYDTVQAERNN